jgi:hypothetical protein
MENEFFNNRRLKYRKLRSEAGEKYQMTEKQKERKKKRRIKETVGKKSMGRGIMLYLSNKPTIYVNNYLFLVGHLPVCRALQTGIGPTRNNVPNTINCMHSHQIRNDIVSNCY